MHSDDRPTARPRRISDPATIKALSHPVRLSLLEVLTFHGPLTATAAGELIDESPTTCSFHLRQLAKYGYVEEAGGGRGRARPWRVTHIGFETNPAELDVAGRVAAQAVASVALSRQVARHERSQRLRTGYPEPWRGAGGHGETVWWVTPHELAALEKEIDSMLYRFHDRISDAGRRPEGAQPVEFVALTHLFEPPADEEGR